MTTHTDLLNYIAKKIGAQTYLEIGVSNGKNFSQIECDIKIGVDPDPSSEASQKITSDKFFEKNPALFDLIFIDGLHEAEQVHRDIENAWHSLNNNGVIVVHDCAPERENMTHVPRDTKVWCGDVYKAICVLCVEKFTMDFDFGCCVIKKDRETFVTCMNTEYYTWEFFNKHRNKLLNLVSVEEGLKLIDSWI